jgi:hypothetical protein
MSYTEKYPWKNCPEYTAWIRMNRVNLEHKIPVYVSWVWVKGNRKINEEHYRNFLKYVGNRPDKHVLIRVDKQQGFIPGNTRWGTTVENATYRGRFRKYSYSRDEELIKELERRGYEVTRHGR